MALLNESELYSLSLVDGIALHACTKRRLIRFNRDLITFQR